MAATTSPSPEPTPAPAPELAAARFDGVTRAVHWANAAVFLFLLLTGLVLSFGPLSAAVGRRETVKDLHVWSGLVLPVPVVLGIAGRWGRQLRADMGRLNRWIGEDRRWLRRLSPLNWGRHSRVPYEFGKFHPGQKLNAAFVGGAIPVMLLTGSIMKWYEPFPLGWRTGATFVHDWTSTALLVVITGHIVKALSTPGALRPMISRTGGGPGPSPAGPPPG